MTLSHIIIQPLTLNHIINLTNDIRPFKNQIIDIISGDN